MAEDKIQRSSVYFNMGNCEFFATCVWKIVESLPLDAVNVLVLKYFNIIHLTAWGGCTTRGGCTAWGGGSAGGGWTARSGGTAGGGGSAGGGWTARGGGTAWGGHTVFDGCTAQGRGTTWGDCTTCGGCTAWGGISATHLLACSLRIQRSWSSDFTLFRCSPPSTESSSASPGNYAGIHKFNPSALRTDQHLVSLHSLAPWSNGNEKKWNDGQLKRLFVVNQILCVSPIRNEWRTLRCFLNECCCEVACLFTLELPWY